MADTWMRLKTRNCPHFRRQIGLFDQATSKRSKSFQVTDDLRLVCIPNALQGGMLGSGQSCLLGRRQEILGEGNEALRGLSQWFSRFVSSPTNVFKAPCTVQGNPLSSLTSPQIGPSLSFFLLPFHPPTSPHHTQSRASSCSVQAVIATPQTSNFALNALNQACRPARRMTNCLPPRGTRCFSLRKTPRHLGLVLGDTHNRPEWKDLLPQGVQTGHHGAELCVSIYG